MDASGTEVGHLVVFHDTSKATAQFNRLITVVSGVVLVLLTALISFLYIVLRRTDQGIQSQQAELRTSKDRFDQLAEQSRTFGWEVDADGLYTYMSHLAEQVIGYRREEVVGRMHFYDLHPEAGREPFKQAALEVFRRKEPFQDLINPIQCEDDRHRRPELIDRLTNLKRRVQFSIVAPASGSPS